MNSGNHYEMYVDGIECTINWPAEAYNGSNGKWFNDLDSRERTAIGLLWRSTEANYFDGSISHVGVWGETSGALGVLTEAQIKVLYDLGPYANWNSASGIYTSTEVGDIIGYWDFTQTTGGTSTVSTLYDHSSPSNSDMTGENTPTIGTAYVPSNSSKRLTFGPVEYSSNVQAKTAVVGNTA